MLACATCGAEFGLFCSACEQEVNPEATICPHCGAALSGSNVETDTELQEIDLTLPPNFNGHCPDCGTALFLEDGFCNQCGAMFCTSCGKEIGDDDEICPQCGTTLFFNCPLCSFELTAGTDQCPNCDALIPSYCTYCRAPLQADAETCSKCATQVHVSRRKSARIIHSLMVGEKVVQIASCPGCGHQMHVKDGACSSCGYRFCPQCQISLEKDEGFCPRCGPHKATILPAPQHTRHCPNCGKPLQPFEDECPHCEHLFCPECEAALSDEDIICPQCGTEFEFECPQCEVTVSAKAEICPSCGFDF